jgi:hypothetical protein
MYTLAIIGGIAALGGHLFWVHGILKGTMHLNLATWIMWAVYDYCVFMVSLSAGATAPFLLLGFVLGASLIVLALLFKGTWKWGRLESVWTAVAVLALIGWYASGPLAALVLLTIGKYSSSIPTIVRGYQRPERNQSWIWFLGTFAAATNIFAGTSWTVAQGLFPSFAFVFSFLTGLVHLRRLPSASPLRSTPRV